MYTKMVNGLNSKLHVIKKVFIILFLIVFIISSYIQVKYERYIVRQKEQYGILKNYERVRYYPAIISFIRCEFFDGQKGNNFKNSDILYSYLGLASSYRDLYKDEYIMSSFEKHDK